MEGNIYRTILVEHYNWTPKTDDHKNLTKTKQSNAFKHLPDSIWKLSISDEKSGNVMSVENPDQFIYSGVHYRFTYMYTKKRLKTIHNRLTNFYQLAISQEA